MEKTKARYRKIHVTMYADERFNALSKPQPNAQTLWVYLLTGPHTNVIPGLSCAGEAAMAEALGWKLEGFREAFAEVSGKALARADWKARVIWIPRSIRYNPPESPNVIRSWAKAWSEIPECALKVVAFTTLKAFVEGLGEGFRKAFGEAFAKGCPNQEQEQEQDIKTPKGVLPADAADASKPNPAEQANSIGPQADAAKGGDEKVRAKPARKAKVPDDAKPEHAEVREHFRERWKAVVGQGIDYAWKHGRDDAHAKWILDQTARDAAQAKAIIDAFLEDEDEWLAKAGHEISMLVSRFNRYRARRPEATGVSENGFVRKPVTQEILDLISEAQP